MCFCVCECVCFFFTLEEVICFSTVCICVERMREGHCQSDKHWNCFKGNMGETSGRHLGDVYVWALQFQAHGIVGMS